MWVRESCANQKKVATHQGFVAKFVAVGMQITTMLNFHEPQKIRKLQYLLKSKTLSGTAIKSILYDWALTLRVHPWSIGTMGQEQGVVTVPARMTITAALLPNIFKRNQVEKKGITGNEVGVPSCILRLDIGFKPNFVLRAVIVFEYRNLNFDSQNIKSHVQDVLIIQVSSYRLSSCFC